METGANKNVPAWSTRLWVCVRKSGEKSWEETGGGEWRKKTEHKGSLNWKTVTSYGHKLAENSSVFQEGGLGRERAKG